MEEEQPLIPPNLPTRKNSFDSRLESNKEEEAAEHDEG